MTSGNMGSALGVVCGLLGHPLVLTMSAGNSLERARMMRGLGAEVVLEPQVDGIPGQVTGNDIQAAVERARAIAIERDGYYVDQFANPGCVEAHEATTGPEIWRALDGRLDAFVAAVGSGGTFIGTARYLRSRMASVYCAAIEPAGAEVLAGEPLRKPRHLLQGTGYGRIPPQWDASLADGYLSVDDTEAVEWRQRLGEAEGLYVGYSAAANVCAAAKLLSSGRLAPEERVVTVLCDTGLKYGVPAQG
jgi:cysteine synthase A